MIDFRVADSEDICFRHQRWKTTQAANLQRFVEMENSSACCSEANHIVQDAIGARARY